MDKKKHILILASRSPQRIRLLKSMRLSFRICPSQASENIREKNPVRLVRKLALKKAQMVSIRFPHHWVLGADTIVVCQGRILGKPKNPRHAEKILRTLNGAWHKVYTGIALVHEKLGSRLVSHEITKVKARRVSPEFIHRFSRKHLDKAGAYSIQDHDDPFIEKIQGNLDNVVGLPRKTLKKLLSLCKLGMDST
ncbi:MAG: septum formation protein Maf [Elusimicrobia bacterium]|nr:septum formation protein Maf [Elusimicrobiota bacterium]